MTTSLVQTFITSAGTDCISSSGHSDRFRVRTSHIFWGDIIQAKAHTEGAAVRCPWAGPPRPSPFSEPLPARFNEVPPDSRLSSETQAQALFYYCGCQHSRTNWVYRNKVVSSAACTAAPETGYKGEAGSVEQTEESLICIRCHLHGWKPRWSEGRVEIHHLWWGNRGTRIDCENGRARPSWWEGSTGGAEKRPLRCPAQAPTAGPPAARFS